jgi:hypothetical protein
MESTLVLILVCINFVLIAFSSNAMLSLNIRKNYISKWPSEDVLTWPNLTNVWSSILLQRFCSSAPAPNPFGWFRFQTYVVFELLKFNLKSICLNLRLSKLLKIFCNVFGQHSLSVWNVNETNNDHCKIHWIISK